ncbi:FAD-dependent oxidoreductase [Croceicoccus sp. F390]|uniref:FAD-dependent oxidoreductase n=1 Tax=Croceicoccus esteveae TaxID=3075597 RepID=A0ABU2ZH87_9SPHN|nr:FAD-dependent oxidoreductase [Croceicoccus sp. F390]MDT0575965.1 FAD-dependent oxidoreductase [Croceicoccus sp. F390]
MTSNRYPHLLSQGRIGSMVLRNRIVVTAMGVSLSEPDGTVGERLIAYHEQQAKGGAGLIVSGVAGVAWPVGAVAVNQTAISDDRFLPGLEELTRRVHAHGACIAAQLHHGGLVAGYSAMVNGHPLWAPSIPGKPKGSVGDYFLMEELAGKGAMPPIDIKVLEKSDIDLVVEQFAAAARRAVTAGFDAVEIHAGHGYLLSSFISPYSNKRTDEYGGSLENRARFALEVLRAVRAEVGPDFPVWMKIDSREVGRQDGITIDLAQQFAKMVEDAGADAVTITAYHDTDLGKLHSQSHTPQIESWNLDSVASIRSAISIPVIGSGRVEARVADRAIGDQELDFIAMGRKLLADPYLPAKLTRGAPDEVRPCIYCYTCISAIYMGDVVRCAVNPELGLELKGKPLPAKGARHVAVVGGGPGGMEAAHRLRALGYRVTLIEKSDRLGGTLRFAALAYEPNGRLLTWLQGQIAAMGVDVRLSTQATPELLRALGVDSVLVATGAVRDMPPIPGSTRDHVYSGDDLRGMMLGEITSDLKRKTSTLSRVATRIGAATGATANPALVRKATHAWMPLADEIVIIGGELVGLELAEFLMERKRTVHVLEQAPRMGKGLTLVRRMRILAELVEHGVTLHAGVSNIAIGKQDVTFDSKDGQSLAIRAGNVIVAQGARGDTALADALKAAGMDVHVYGDALGVGYIEGAMRGAADAVARVAGGRIGVGDEQAKLAEATA